MIAERPSVAFALILIIGCSRLDDKVAREDSAFEALQQRGETAMGVDQHTSQHVFEPVPDGGRIVLQRKVNDSAGEATIRAHMREISTAFRNGDFALPGFVHATGDVPGTAVMKRLKSEISYTPRDLPGGAEVVIFSKNPEAVLAVHDFLAFQQMDHRAGSH